MLIMTYLDDISGELLSHGVKTLMDSGVKNIHLIPTITKKGRPGYILLIDLKDEIYNEVIRILIREFGVLGYRIIEAKHIEIPYEVKTAKVRYKDYEDSVRVKEIYHKDLRISLKAEYEDLKRIQRELKSRFNLEVSLKKLKEYIEAEAYKGIYDINLAGICEV